jgi:aminomethyltransferase
VRTSPLDAVHRELGAKMVPFGGWEMPVSYPSGTVEEHLACRTAAVVFDVSHLGTVRVEGPGAHALLQAALTNDLDRVGPGRAQYTHLLDPSDASVTDDIIVWWVGGERFDVMPNASNTDGVTGALSEVLASTGGGATMADVTAERAILAVQGPTAREVVAKVSPEAAEVGRFRVVEFEWDGHHCVAAGTGYTGEDGLEIAVPVAGATALWHALTGSGALPAGLGARDTLRLESGLPLHGHELGPGITSLNAELGWVVRFDKPEFRGKAALEAQRDAGGYPVLRGVQTSSRRPLRQDQAVLRNGEPVGTLTSGNFSPSLGVGIGLALLPADVQPGDELAVDVRGTAEPAVCVALPFVTKK